MLKNQMRDIFRDFVLKIVIPGYVTCLLQTGDFHFRELSNAGLQMFLCFSYIRKNKSG